MYVEAPVLRMIARTRTAKWGLIHDCRLTMIVTVVDLRRVPPMSVMAGHPAIAMDMRRRGSSRQTGPRSEEHHDYESHDLPQDS
jgi:hypothetical protein